MTISRYLEKLEPRFDARTSLLSSTWSSSGYHSRIKPGSTVHPLRDSLSYAAYLFRHRAEDSVRRGHEVAAAVLEFQDKDPTSRTFGVWPYLAEEPLEAMNPPDWNWADFLGSTIGLICSEFGDRLEKALVSKLHAALERAAYAIFRRNIGPDYTNIAIMGAGVCLMAGEQLDDPLLLDYGRRRLSNIDAHRRRHGDFSEYNSPTYTFVAIEELARILHTVEDEGAVATARALYHHAWKVIADHYHPPTAQLAGPHSRAYSDRLPARAATVIEAGTGRPVPCPDAGRLERGRRFDAPPPELFVWERCPEERADAFASKKNGTIHTPFIRGVVAGGDIAGTTWFGARTCVGSISADSSWVQRHGLIAYWRSAAEVVTCLTARVLKNGKDFASFMVRCAQEGPEVLCGFSPLTNGGDWHLYLDHPEDHVFSVEDLRVRFEISSPVPVEIERVAESYAVSADATRVEVVPVGGAFRGEDVRWETGGEGGVAWIDAVLYDGDPVAVDFSSLKETWVAAALRFDESGSGTNAPVERTGLSVDRRPDVISVRRQTPQLEITIPRRSERYPLDPSIWKQG